MPTRASLVLALFAAAASAQATWPAGGTVTSTKPVKQPPFYRGEILSGTAARLPVTLAPLPAGTPESWLPMAALERLAADMEAWLDRAHVASVLTLETGAPKAVAPTVYLGCSLDGAIDECSEEERLNILAVSGGTREWRQRLSLAAAETGAGRTLAVQLAIAPHWIRQRGLKGTKQAALGTGYLQDLPWLTSLDTPVWVVQVTGVVVDTKGEVARSGGEGIWALRTPFRASALRAQKLLTDEDVEFVRTELRRPDLPGAPLAWEAALHQLVVQLLGTSGADSGLEAR